MIDIGQTSDGRVVSLPLRLANRHGLVTGATGTGKTRTLQLMMEQLSAAGVPCFAADVKGDLSGIASPGDANGPAMARASLLGRPWGPAAAPVAFWDIFGIHGLPIRTSVQEMGALMLSSMLGLNETQAGAMAIAFRKSEDEQSYISTLDDLRWALNDLLEMREEVCKAYGNITASSISAIQRNLLALEAQGGVHLFGEPPFEIADLMRTDEHGHGIVNLLHADQLMEAPRLYSTFLLWLLTELFRKLPEAGDLDKPKLVFFFDEAHLLFTDAPKPLVQQIERLVRLVRSKGVGVYFVTQSPSDLPDNVLEQLGTRICHAMRAHTIASQKKVRAAADTLRSNKGVVDARIELPNLGNGEALISVFGADEVPTPVEKVMIVPPSGQMGPISDLERQTVIALSPMFIKYRGGLKDFEASHAFNRRMKIARGIDPGPADPAQEWMPGDYMKFVPDFTQAAARPRRVISHALQIVVCAPLALGCFWFAGLFG